MIMKASGKYGSVRMRMAISIFLFITAFFGATIPASAQPADPTSTVELSTRYPSFLPFFATPRADLSLGPVLTAKSALLYDMDAKKVLLAKDPAVRLPVASLTKLMTVTVAIESGLPFDREVPVPAEAVKLEPSKLYLLARDSLSVRELILASLIASANDAAYTLASALPDALSAMNRKAYELGLLDTRFSTPTGLDDPDNYSSAVDIARVFDHALTLPLAAEAMRTRSATVTSSEGKRYELDNTNIFLGRKGIDVIAGKTGTTDEAGQCLIVLVRLDNGHRVLGVLLGSKARFPEMRALIAWAETDS